jgi:DNA integrity scanning protein DisA with diadenylate cyclase activity
MERIQMIKKLILVLLSSLLFLTGCQNIKSVNLSKMVLNSSKIKSSESRMTASLDLTYNRAQIRDKDLLKVLDIINHAKFEVETKVQNSNTASLAGNVVLQQGKIPFKIYMDNKKMVLSLDNATTPIRVPLTNGTSKDSKLLLDLQTKILAPTVKNLPNPKHISVKTTSEKVHGVKVKGFDVYAKIHASDTPKLLRTFIDNLIKDDKAISQIVAAVNELNTVGGVNKVTGENSKLTAEEFKAGLEQFKMQLNQSLPQLKQLNILTTKNYFKTHIFVDRKFYVRKTSSILNIGDIPDGNGLKVIRLSISNENWNLNKHVKAIKVNYSKKNPRFLEENLTEKEFLKTLDKKRSVLYSVMTSFTYKKSEALKSSKVKIKNNKRKADSITVKGLKKGDIIKVYKAKTGGKLLAAKQATGSTVSFSIKQLGKKSGKVYVSVMHSGMAESAHVAVKFKKE